MARKITIKELGNIIREEVEAAGKDEVDIGGGTPNEEAKKTDEIEASEYADTLAQEIDHMKAYKIKEAKAVALAKKIRARRKKLAEAIKRKREELEKAKLVAENKKLRAALRQAKAVKDVKSGRKKAPSKK